MTSKDIASILLLAAVWGGSFPFIRVAAPALGPLPLAAGRVMLAALVLWAGLRLLRQRVALRGHGRALLVVGAANAAVPFGLIGAAELHLTASLAAMLNATVPMWAVLFGALWLGERLTLARVVGVALGLAGVGVLVGWSPIETTPATLWSVAAMLVATCCYAFSGVYIKRRLSGIPTPVLALGQQLGAAAWLVVPALWLLPDAEPTRPALLSFLALAVVCTAAAYLLYFRLIASVGPTRTTLVTYLVPVFGTTWGALFLDEPLSAGMFAGLALILGGIVLVSGAWPRRAAVARDAAEVARVTGEHRLREAAGGA